MLPATLLNINVTVMRRNSQGRDALNNPIYGQPTTSPGWAVAYSGMPVKLAFSTKPTNFAPEGERIQPIGTLYYNTGYVLQPEDRIITPDGVEYNIISIVNAYLFGNVIDHYEAIVQLP